jgi:hemerythrin-like domain-containing protein
MRCSITLERALPQAASVAEVRGLAALLAAALVPHAQLENAGLFAALEERIGPAGPLAVMRAEHNAIEGTLADLGAGDVDTLRARVRHAIAQARDHFRKEEMILFPLAVQQLGAPVLTRLGKEWAEARGVTVR